MKNRKLNLFRWSILGFAILGTIGSAISCTDKVGDSEIGIIQGNSDTVSTPEVALGMMKGAMLLIHDTREHKYQYQFNLHIDAYAGYFTVANNLEGRIPSSYFINPDFESGPLTSFLWIANPLIPVMNSSEKLKRLDLHAISNIMLCYAASECVDVYGPMPYFDYLKLKSEPPMTYNTVEEIYTDLFLQLRKANEILNTIEISSEEKIQLQKYDLIGGGNFKIWRKFANSLRLRLAMRIVKIDPEKAKNEAEAAITDGVLGEDEVTDKNIVLDGYKYKNLYVLSQDWNDTRLGASLGNILERLGHPYLNKYFTKHLVSKNSQSEPVGLPEEYAGYMGIRPGTSVPTKLGTNPYASFSGLNNDIGNMPITFFKVCEVFFLRCEGALRGWAMNGTAKSLYTKGLKASFEKENLGTATELSTYNSRKIANLPYIDLYDKSNSYDEKQGVVNIATQWDDKASKEENLERIITQKYVANFPLSLESWSEFRRTGYPRLIPVSYDGGDFSIPTGGYIRRMTFQRSGTVEPADVERTGVPALGGPDEQATRLWWDVDAPNF